MPKLKPWYKKLLKSKEIKTWVEPQEDKYTMKRAEYTCRFIAKHLDVNNKDLLDIGEENPVGKFIAKRFDLKYYNTFGDLDIYFSSEQDHLFDAVICLEVMEHLLAPKHFLINLKLEINVNAQIFFSYPSRPHFLWTSQHFHEYDKKRFIYLLDQCGYEVVKWKRMRIPSSFWSRFRGMRPFLRSFVNYDNLVYARLKK